MLKKIKICYNCNGDKMKKAVKKVNKTTNKKNDNVKNVGSEITELRKLAYIFGIIILVFLIFYGIAYLKLNNNNKQEEEIVKNIQYEEILVNNILNQNKENYYVLIYNDEVDYSNYYYYYVQKYNKNENSLFVYLVDIENAFNIAYKSDTSNLMVDDISKISIKEDTLLKISNGKIVSSFEGMENIVNNLK